jgi:probable phosphoglycerate mutase
LQRARKTAEIVGQKVGAPVIYEDRLMERDFGLTDGTYEGTPGFTHTFQQFGYQYPEGETLLRVVQRVYNLLDEIKFRYENKNIMIISHGGVCRVINSYFSSLSNEEFFDFFLENCKVLEYEL